MIETLLSLILCISSTICLWSAFLLAYDWQGCHQRRWLALVLFLWGAGWTARTYGLFFGDSAQRYSIVLPPGLILGGILASFTFLVWPMTVLNAPRLRPRRILSFLLPFILCIVIYYGMIAAFRLPRFEFTSIASLWSHIGYFSVWFRLVMCACLLGYLYYTIRLVRRYIGKYNRYVEENFAEYEKYTIRWMPRYLLGLVAISVLFFVNLCFASYATLLCHNVVSCIFLAWLTAKVMVYNSPYAADNLNYAVPEVPKAAGEDFKSRFDVYLRQIKTWLVNERPYLRADFNLKDVMAFAGLNRTYASKIFNDGFGKSFIFVVRELRIDYARRLIDSNPAVSMADVAALCGYSTPQAFHKAFVFCNDGLTPGQYARRAAATE